MTRHLLSIRPRPLLQWHRVLLAALLALAMLVGRSSNPKPITKNGLTQSLRIGGLSPKELINQITQRGVDFNLNSDSETELRRAGANTLLLDAVRNNYRQKGNPGNSVDTAPMKPPDAPAPADAKPGHPRRVLVLRDVHKLYIDKMPNGLDGYLGAAISRKLSSFFIIVLDRPAADAILQSADSRSPGTISMVDTSGKIVLWSGFADDKEKLYLNFRHGGQREVADKLAAQLKKALD